MTALYQIANEITELNNIDVGEDDSLDEAIKNSLDCLEMDLNEKIDNIVKLSQSMSGDISQIKSEIKRLQDRNKSFINKQESLKSYIIKTLQSIDKKSLKTALFTVSQVAGRDKVIIDNESAIPNDYISVKVVESPDKKELLAELKNGNDVPGCHIEKSDASLRIK